MLGENKTIISLEDIKCKKLVDTIKLSTERILRFKKVMNDNLKNAHLDDPKILITRKETWVHDYNNEVFCGYEYNVFWCLPFINVHDKSGIFKTFQFGFPDGPWPPYSLYYNRFELINILNENQNMWPPFYVFFVATLKERADIHKFINFRPYDIDFQLCITDYCYDTDKKNNVRIFSECDHCIKHFLMPPNMYKYIDIIDNIYIRFKNEINICQQLKDAVIEKDLVDHVLSNTEIVDKILSQDVTDLKGYSLSNTIIP